jgi:L-ascorbate metabolism protein UlaG (beta-lactamase superfamily)
MGKNEPNPLPIVPEIMALIPVLGKDPAGTRLRRIRNSPHYENGSFQNLTPTEVTLKDASLAKMLGEYRNRPVNTAPNHPLPAIRTDLRGRPSDQLSIVWFGHSSYLVKIKEFHILVDPVFSGNASPVSFFGKAFPGTDIYEVKDMPAIDLVLLTHDHYDHLDYKTIRELIPTARHFVTSLGVGSHLEYWGIPAKKITELDWGEGCTIDATTARIIDGPSRTAALPSHGQLTLTATPARHFSGRTIKRGRTLWSSFVLKTSGAPGNGSAPGSGGAPAYSLFLGGDSGYEQHFKTIGDKYGPFDIAILECGQYGKNWPYIHMLPEETVAAAIDLRAKVLLPVHWGKFSLALHPWNEPIQRMVTAAAGKGLALTTPLIGEPVILEKEYPHKKWWD